MPTASPAPSSTRVVGYVRVSTSEQAESGAGLAAQRATIKAEADRRGWVLVAVYEDAGISGKTMTGRAGLDDALLAVEKGEAQVLVVAKLDRLSRSLLDFANLMERSRRKRWALVALDLGVDTTTPAGEMVASLMATFAQYERRIIGVRTKEALAVKKAEGVVLGRPRVLSLEVVGRIWQARQEGQTLAAIADSLNAEGIPTAHKGAKWHRATIRQVLLSNARPGAQAVARLTAEHDQARRR